jgi:general L-amino acid transport system permease protein
MRQVSQFVGWARRNLFASPTDAVLSVITLPLTGYLVFLMARWVLAIAKWSVIADNIRVLLTGTIPVGFAGNAWGAAALMIAMFGATLGSLFSARHVVRLTGFALLCGTATLALALTGLGRWPACSAVSRPLQPAGSLRDVGLF